MISGDQLLTDIRDIFFTHQAEWLSLSGLVSDLRCQPYAAYHAQKFHEATLARRLADFGIRTCRRNVQPGYVLDDLLRDRIRRYAPGAPRMVRVVSDPEEASDGLNNTNEAAE